MENYAILSHDITKYVVVYFEHYEYNIKLPKVFPSAPKIMIKIGLYRKFVVVKYPKLK